MNTRLQTSAETSSLHHKVYDVQHIYNRYAGMLLGYIYDVVKDKALAEQYLADTFIAVVKVPELFNNPNDNVYCKLQMIARKRLAGYFKSVGNCEVDEIVSNRPNTFLSKMNVRQQTVFCGVHYHGKSIPTIAAEMNEDEDVVRRVLREAFVIIRTR
ncbi:hypothetical protein [Mucilaginibacter defluvii]|uniref:DNA-directed RNA polymerase specialized sigma24 family protein n=1 Tax=Mucilaginibacter defluvii TaxID=1196019 RepID=A0ABP9FXZ8_9SPHI